MELSEIIEEIRITPPEDAKLTLCFMLGYLSEIPEIWDSVKKAYESAPKIRFD